MKLFSVFTEIYKIISIRLFFPFIFRFQFQFQEMIFSSSFLFVLILIYVCDSYTCIVFDLFSIRIHETWFLNSIDDWNIVKNIVIVGDNFMPREIVDTLWLYSILCQNIFYVNCYVTKFNVTNKLVLLHRKGI